MSALWALLADLQRIEGFGRGEQSEARERLRRWKARAVAVIRQAVSSAEAANLEAKGEAAVLGDPQDGFDLTVRGYRAVLVALIDELKSHGLPEESQDVSAVPCASPSIGETNSGRTLLIHGRDKAALLDLKNLLQNSLGLPEPIVMSEMVVPGATLPEKFESLASKVDLAIALLSPDDMGGLSSEEGVAYQPRARQNVFIEIGWFWGRTGRSSLFLLVRGRVEIPSDLQGLEQYTFTESPAEQVEKLRNFFRYHRVPLS